MDLPQPNAESGKVTRVSDIPHREAVAREEKLSARCEELEKLAPAEISRFEHFQELARAIGLVPRTTPIESAQSNGMAAAFVKAFKRDYAQANARPDAATVLRQFDSWFAHYHAADLHDGLGCG